MQQRTNGSASLNQLQAVDVNLNQRQSTLPAIDGNERPNVLRGEGLAPVLADHQLANTVPTQ